METEIIGVPLYYGCDNPGTEQAYDALMQEGLIGRLHTMGVSAQTCKIEVPPAGDKLVFPLMKYQPQVAQACRRLEQAVDHTLTKGIFPFVLGGDHSLGIGSVAGISHHCPKEQLTVIWVDAHTDINTEQTSSSHNIHGMPLAACLGLGDSKLWEGQDRKPPYLQPENLLYLGSRSVDEGERKLIAEQGIACSGMDEIRRDGIQKTARRLLEQVKTPWIHVSFDVDFMDGGEFSATGLPVPNGPSIRDAGECLQILLSDPRVKSMDFVEYSPKHDTDKKGLAVCMDLIETAFHTLADRG